MKRDFHIRMNMAQSLDGHIIQPDGKFDAGTGEDKRRMDRLRAWADCVIASRRSMEADNPTLYVRSKPNSPKQPRPIIVLGSPRAIDPALQIFAPPHPPGELWLQSKEADPAKLWQSLADGENREAVVASWQIFNFASVVEICQSLAERGYQKILLEGGGSLNGLFIEHDLVDEIFFTIVPYIWGGTTTDRIVSSKEMLVGKKFRLGNVERRKNEVFFRYERTGVSKKNQD